MKRPAKLPVSPDFIRFGIVGTLGFCWDTATVYALRHLVGLYVAGTAGFLVAATANWLLNRLWTFRHQTHQPRNFFYLNLSK
jgi:putative flippase GtrA